MKYQMTAFMPSSKTVTMLLLTFKESVIKYDCISLCTDVFRTFGGGIIDWNTIRIIEYSHSEIDPIMRKKLVIGSDFKIVLKKTININLRRFVKCFRLKIDEKILCNSINFWFTENRNAICFYSEVRNIHRLKIILSAFSVPLQIAAILLLQHPDHGLYGEQRTHNPFP